MSDGKLLSYATHLPGPSLVTAPHWALHDRLIKPRFTLQNAPGDFQPKEYAGPTPILAVGLPTMADQEDRRKIARRTMHERFRSLLARELVVWTAARPLRTMAVLAMATCAWPSPSTCMPCT